MATLKPRRQAQLEQCLTTSNTLSAAKRTSQAITTLYTVCLVFIITLSPTAIITAIQYIQYYTEKSPDLLCNLMIAESPLQMVRLSNYAINFIIYGFTGRQFRREIVAIAQKTTELERLQWLSRLSNESSRKCWLFEQILVTSSPADPLPSIASVSVIQIGGTSISFVLKRWDTEEHILSKIDIQPS